MSTDNILYLGLEVCLSLVSYASLLLSSPRLDNAGQEERVKHFAGVCGQLYTYGSRIQCCFSPLFFLSLSLVPPSSYSRLFGFH